MHNFRGLTDVGGTLAQTYFDNGQLHEALDAINAAIQANTNIPNELYLAPANLALKAKIVDKMGNSKAADALFRKSTTLVDSMIQRASTVGVERQLLAEMSDIYSAYFASLCRQGRYDDALEVLENVRGRLEAEALAASQFPASSCAYPTGTGIDAAQCCPDQHRRSEEARRFDECHLPNRDQFGAEQTSCRFDCSSCGVA